MSETRIISCEEALRLLAEHLDGELGGAHRREVERHLEICRSCFSRAEFEQRLKARLVTVRERAVEATFEERIRTLIGRFAVTPEE